MSLENTPHDEKWQALLARSASTFSGHEEPPYGFVTSTLARLKSERRERELLERIGFRALFASMAILVGAVFFTVGVQLQDRFDLDPALKGILLVKDVTIA